MAIIPAFPFTLTNGTLADASQVMANFNNILNSTNANGAHNGPNSDITSISGLTTPLSVVQGGTGQTALGLTGQVLTSTGGASVWQTGVTGVTDGSNAPAGQVGEFVTVSSGTVLPGNATVWNVASMPLSAGDWEVWGTVDFIGGTGSPSVFIASISNSPSTFVFPAMGMSFTSGIINVTAGVATSRVRISSNAAGTYYLNMQTNFASGAPQFNGVLNARRMR